jgi:hypothetical protein
MRHSADNRQLRFQRTIVIDCERANIASARPSKARAIVLLNEGL